MTDTCFSGWAEAFALGSAAAGGKGWNLARLARYGFSVPPGGVLLTKAYRCFLAENGLTDAVADAAREGSEPAGASGFPATARLKELILSAPMPDAIMHEITGALTELKIADVPLAVRSSATVEDSSSASFAGIFESFLNVRGSLNVASAIKRCWASLWTEKAISYRRRMGLADVAPETAVVIMAMVEAEAAGVAFSCDPRSGREDVVYVAANLGLGESVVAGAAEPDEYAVVVGFHAPQMSLLSKKIGRKEKMTIAAGTGGTLDVASGGTSDVQALPDHAVMTLARLVRRIYGALGHHEEHQDVEWVFDGSRFHVVQSRPVTVLPRHSYEGLHDEPDYWSNANLREVLPMVISPLGWTTMSDPLEKILTLPLRVSGYRPLPGVVRKRLFAGRGYFNISVMQWEYHAAFAVPPTRLNDIIGGHQPEVKVPALTPTMFIRCAGRTIRYLVRTIGARRRADAACAAIRAYAAGILASSLAARSDRELTALVRQVGERMEASTDVHLVLSGGGATFMVLAPLLDYFFPGKGTSVANALLVGAEGITSAEHGLLLADLADLVESDPAARQFFSRQPLETDRWQEALPASSLFGKAFRDFLGTYGHRGVYELDIRNARWREDPSWLLKVVQGNIGGGHAGILRKRQRETAETAWRHVRARIPRLLHPFIRGLVRRAGKEAAQREMAKSTLVHISGVLRAIAQEVGSRLVAKGLLPERDDIYFAGWEELEDILTGMWDGRGLDHLTSDRKTRHAALEKMPAPDLIEAGVARHVRSPEVGTGEALVGIGVAAGVATGPVRIILHPDDGHRLRPGDVLVAPSTDPAWTPLFLRMAALITETGGYISHGAIVAREYGIPAVVNVPGVLERLKEGEEVTVDGNTGRVTLHRETKSKE